MGQFHTEGRIATFVPDKLLPIQINLRRVVGSVDFQIVFFTAQFLGRELAHIPAHSAVIIVAAVLAVDGVPGVGQRDRLAARGIGRRSINGDGGF